MLSFDETSLKIDLLCIISALFGGFSFREWRGSLGQGTALFGQWNRGHSDRYTQGGLFYHIREVEAILIRVGGWRWRMPLLMFWKIRLQLCSCHISAMAVISSRMLEPRDKPYTSACRCSQRTWLKFSSLTEFHGGQNRSRYHPSTGTGNESSRVISWCRLPLTLPLNARCSPREPSPSHAPLCLS